MLEKISEMIEQIENEEALKPMTTLERKRLQARYDRLIELQEKLMAEEG